MPPSTPPDAVAPITDFHIHYTPASLLRLPEPAAKRSVEYVRGVPAYYHHDQLADIARHVDVLETAGIDRAVLSSAPGFDAPLDACRRVNEELAEVADRYPGRIEGMAHAPVLAGDDGLEEIVRAHREHGFRALVVSSTIGGRTLDDPALEPVYDLVEELGMLLFVHPSLGVPSFGLDGFGSYDLYRTVGREYDMQLAVLRLILGGVLDRHTRMRVLISHLGGGIAAVWGRVRAYQAKDFWAVSEDPDHGRTANEDPDVYLGRLFFDTGGFFGDMTAVRAALLRIPSTQIVFGTDYPQELRNGEDVRGYLQRIRELGDDGEAILRRNAGSLLPAGMGAR